MLKIGLCMHGEDDINKYIAFYNVQYRVQNNKKILKTNKSTIYQIPRSVLPTAFKEKQIKLI